MVVVAQAAVGLSATHFIGKLGTDALAGMALVFPVVMPMQMNSAGAMGVSGASLEASQTYSHWVSAGTILV